MPNRVSGGWVLLRDEAAIRALRQAKIPCDGLISQRGSYVPPWVKEAVDLYNKNPGYADMTMVEFLVRMNPSNKP